MSRIVLNIPYSSKSLPNLFYEHTSIEQSLIEDYNTYETEIYIDRIFGKNTFPKIIAPYSKLYCDILNLDYYNDKNNFEFIKTKTNKNKTFIKPTKEYINLVLNEYYKPLHNRIEQSLNKQCSKGKTIFIDCHSHSLNNSDICISFDDKYKNIKLIDYIKKYFEALNYSTDINNTIKGSFIPYNFKINQNDNLSCIRISVNQNLYSMSNEPNQNFKKVQKQIQELLKQLKETEF